MNYADLKAIPTRGELFAAIDSMSEQDVLEAHGEAPAKDYRTPHDSWIAAALAARLLETGYIQREAKKTKALINQIRIVK